MFVKRSFRRTCLNCSPRTAPLPEIWKCKYEKGRYSTDKSIFVQPAARPARQQVVNQSCD